MQPLRFATAGSVDDGKSTLIGRLLYDARAIQEDQLAAVERASLRHGAAELDLSLLTDGLEAEREQGIHIDGDALLALGLQAVSEERQVELRRPVAQRCPLHRGELVLLDRARVVEQPPDERALAVVDAARGGESKRLHKEGQTLLFSFR